MSLIVGITGGIGSGKSAVTERFEQLGISSTCRQFSWIRS